MNGRMTDYIYNGTLKSGYNNLGENLYRRNRPALKKKPSILKIILIIITFTSFGVLIINNIITINDLVKQNYELEREYNAIKSVNEALIAEINKKSSYENIIPRAERKLGMKKISPSQIIWFELPDEQK